MLLWFGIVLVFNMKINNLIFQLQIKIKIVAFSLKEKKMVVIKDKQTGEIVGKVMTNHSLNFDEAMRLAGFEWKNYPDVECEGWYSGDILHDESNTEIETK